MAASEIKVWNATKGNLFVGHDKKIIRSNDSMWVVQDESVLFHLGKGSLIKIDEKSEEAPAPAPTKKKKSDTTPIVEEPSSEENANLTEEQQDSNSEDSILDGGQE